MSVVVEAAHKSKRSKNRHQTELMNMTRMEMNFTVVMWLCLGVLFLLTFIIVEAKYYIARLNYLGLPLAIPQDLKVVNYNCWGAAEVVFLLILAIRFLPYTLVVFDVGGGESVEQGERFGIYMCTFASLCFNISAKSNAKVLDSGIFGDSNWLLFLWWWRQVGMWVALGIDFWAFQHICRLPIVNKGRFVIMSYLGLIAGCVVWHLWEGMPPCQK